MESHEDMGLAAAVRTALGEGVALGADRRQSLLAEAAAEAKRRQMRLLFGRWRRPALLAAALALSLAFFAVFSDGTSEDDATDGMRDAIALLSELDGLRDEGLSAGSPGELLLAWQEAPCADLLL